MITRYHSIIIMTDADVDGSHIRTLLLTFFYRQMPELIERGYIYIAQPPLFKVKKNKQERYVKDEKALDDLLFQTALDGAAFHGSDNQVLSGQALNDLVNEYHAMINIINRLGKRLPREFIEALMYAPVINEACLANRDDMEKILKDIQDKLNQQTTLAAYYEIDLVEDPERHWFLPKIQVTSHGVSHSYMINKELFLSTDYRKIAEFGTRIAGMQGWIQRDDKKQAVDSFAKAITFLLAEAKKGQTIQRYKGLGEMNPEQLWETTMDPERRVLLQVKVEDAIAADKIFTTLMGDEVEPRRQFIEQNALEVINLDV